jgi:septum site-determining protein MinC
VTVTARPRSSLRLRGRSFLALVLAPQAPLSAWLAELDALVRGSPGFFTGRPVLLDVSSLGLDESGLAALVADLSERNVRIMGIEGAGSLNPGLGMPPLVSSGRHHDLAEPGEPAAAEPPKPSAPASLLLTEPVRSGQSVIFPQGDVTIVGSVSSGAEVVAGGSIHIYGALRGRAVAGSTGNADARIFCRKLEAELVAIDGLYLTADEMEAHYRERSVHAWLEGEAIRMAALN